jgi:hypothetical protein
MTQSRFGKDRRGKLVPGQGPAGQRLAHHRAKDGPVLWRHPDPALPTGPLPRSPKGQDREEGSAVFGGEQVERAAHRPGLDQPAFRQLTVDVIAPRPFLADTDRQLGGRWDLGLNSAQAADDLDDGPPADRVQQLTLHAPRKRLLPADLDDSSGTHLARRSSRRARTAGHSSSMIE